jgi:uracil phosphoribosyltransferase
MLEEGTPEQIFIVSAIASREGLEYVESHFPQAHLVVGAIDEELTAKGYIVPGLGDAGDLAFGHKVQN